VQRAHAKAEGNNAQILERALDHVVQMDRVVTGALQVARSGREAREEDVLLTEVVGRAAEAARAFASAVELDVLVEPDTVRGDKAALTQCVLNVMLNAVEASSPAGRVTVQSRREESCVRLDVEDSGPGFTLEALAHALEPLFTTKASGTGLGLSIARQIALAHGGDIEITNGDAGARVSIFLPKGG
jgi:two-component system, NtrC family, sensor histidine kinase HydH